MDALYNAFDKMMNVLMKTAETVPYTAKAKPILVDPGKFRTNYPFIIVSGFWSWGQYQKGYKTLPYWGFFTGENYVDSINQSGMTAAAADLSPMGSAWDRACELYAQLTGTRVDYGKAHSEKFGHPRYGEDYHGRALIQNWNKDKKINIICHSFGCPTSALFATILADGSKEEQDVTTDGSLSPFFEGGKGEMIHSITGVAGAYNGTSLILGRQAIEDNIEYYKKKHKLHKIDPAWRLIEKAAVVLENVTGGDTPDMDTGLYDMIPDNSVILNESIHTVDNIYYFTIPCCMSKHSEKKNASVPDMKITDYFFIPMSEVLGMVDITTPGGIELKKDWQPNDGLVNTISEYGPEKENKIFLHTTPTKKVLSENIHPGQYYVFETCKGSHNTLSGGTVRPNRKAKAYLYELMEMINLL